MSATGMKHRTSPLLALLGLFVLGGLCFAQEKDPELQTQQRRISRTRALTNAKVEMDQDRETSSRVEEDREQAKKKARLQKKRLHKRSSRKPEPVEKGAPENPRGRAVRAVGNPDAAELLFAQADDPEDVSEDPEDDGASDDAADDTADGADDPQIVAEPGEPISEPVTITEGDIPLRDFLRFLADSEQLTVLTDSSDQKFLDREITILTRIENANYDIVKAILETNKIRVFRENLPSGTEIIKCEPMQTGQQPSDPKDVPVLEVDERGTTVDPNTDTEAVVGDDEFATIVFTLEHVAPADAIKALQALVGGQASTSQKRGGSSTFSMVEIENTQTLIITAKFGLLSYLKTLLQLIDVPFKEPERIIQILQIEWADASELQSVIEEFLQGRGRGSRFGRRGQRQVTGGAAAGRGNAASRGGSSGRRDTTFETNIIPDTRTNKLIIETYDVQDLQDIEMLVGELDVRFEQRRLRTHIYQVRYLKAEDTASDLERLVSGGSGGRSGRGGRTSRLRQGVGRSSSRSRTGGAAGGQGQNTGAPQNVELPALIVPHVPTNSLLIQAEAEDYDEILSILEQIDTKRRQVFLEAALVQVQSSSNLAFAIDVIAGNPDDQDTRGLFASSFTGLSAIDLENFDRIIGADPTSPGQVPTGGFFALMKEGDFPLLLRFLKSSRDSQILATPFIVADDNEDNSIEILETRYVQQTSFSQSGNEFASQTGEPAGITLALTPTISGSDESDQKAVFLELELSVSEFQEAAVSNVLPPKTENTLTSSVTIPNGTIFVVGGLTRENNSTAVSKIPILGDIPILGKLFREEVTSRSQNNLYVFLKAHVLTHERFGDIVELTQQAEKQMHKLGEDVEPTKFTSPKTSGDQSLLDKRNKDERRFFELSPNRQSAEKQSRYGDGQKSFKRDGNSDSNRGNPSRRRDQDSSPPPSVPSSSYDETRAPAPRDTEGNSDFDRRRRSGGFRPEEKGLEEASSAASATPSDFDQSNGWFELE